MQGIEQRIIAPQPGAQSAFLSSSADITVYGGAAGGGKSYAILLDPLRYISNPGFRALIFRRTFKELNMSGGLWDESQSLYSLVGGRANYSKYSWVFPSGAEIGFANLQHQSDIKQYQGAQIAYIGLDEATHFTEDMFWFLTSRNRSVAGIPPCIRMTCNPDAGSWLRKFIDYWVGDDGYPDPGTIGIHRYYRRIEGELIWADDREDLPESHLAKSVTFIPATLADNRILMEKDKGYLANLESLPEHERDRYLLGNWDSVQQLGVWPSNYFTGMMVDELPSKPWLKIMSVDPSMGKDSMKGDYSAIDTLNFVGDVKEWCCFVDCFAERIDTSSLIDVVIEMYKIHKPDAIAVEVNNFGGEWLIRLIEQAAAEGITLPIWEVNNTINKVIRLQLRLTPLLQQGKIRLIDSPGSRLLLKQAQEFPKSNHDDCIDSLEIGLQVFDAIDS